MKKIIVYIFIITCITSVSYLWLSNTEDDSCLENLFYYNQFTYDEVDGSTLYLVNNEKQTVDSTRISLTTLNDTAGTDLIYVMDKALPLESTWKIVFKKTNSTEIPESITVSDIEVETIDQRNMFGKTRMCRVYSWKVNGVQYSIDNGDKFIN